MIHRVVVALTIIAILVLSVKNFFVFIDIHVKKNSVLWKYLLFIFWIFYLSTLAEHLGSLKMMWLLVKLKWRTGRLTWQSWHRRRDSTCNSITIIRYQFFVITMLAYDDAICSVTMSSLWQTKTSKSCHGVIWVKGSLLFLRYLNSLERHHFGRRSSFRELLMKLIISIC